MSSLPRNRCDGLIVSPATLRKARVEHVELLWSITLYSLSRVLLTPVNLASHKLIGFRLYPYQSGAADSKTAQPIKSSARCRPHYTSRSSANHNARGVLDRIIQNSFPFPALTIINPLTITLFRRLHHRCHRRSQSIQRWKC